MWSLEKRGLRRRCCKTKLPELQWRLQYSGGHGKEKKTGSKLTGQTGSSSGLTSPQGSLTGVQTGLTGASSKSGNSSTAQIRTRPSFKELLAKYEKEAVAQKQKGQPDKAKGTKLTSTSSEQSDPHPHQGNCVVMPQSGSVTPYFWPYPCYYTLLDYSRMYMQPYYIQYPSIYPSLPHKDRLTIT